MRNARQVSILAIAGLAAATAVTTAAAGSAEEPPAAQPTTLELVARPAETRFGQVDAPPRGRENAGDVWTVSGRLREAGGRSAGHVQAVFTATSAIHASGELTFTLRDGKLIAAGLIDRAGPTDELVIVGGSGAYAGVHGTVVLRETRAGQTFRFTLVR